MDFIANHLNKSYPESMLINAEGKTEHVRMAVAYAHGRPRIFDFCKRNLIKLEYWCRYDNSLAVAPDIFQWFLELKSPNYVCRLVPDILHSKLIWFVNYGVYIGSANLTRSAWQSNAETGLFLTHDEVVYNNLETQLAHYFEQLNKISHPLTDEVYQESLRKKDMLKNITKATDDFENEMSQKRVIPQYTAPTYDDPRSPAERRKDTFLKEWNETLQSLREISKRVSMDYRPSWVTADVPRGAQADQFLHAYYYNSVKKGNKSYHKELHTKNKNDPEAALVEAMKWWKSTATPPSEEDVTFYKWAPAIKKSLSEGRLLHLSKQEFVSVCSKIHALREHALQASHKTLKLKKPLPKMDRQERVEYLGNWIFDQRSEGGNTPLQTIHHLLWGGGQELVPERLWEVTEGPDWKIPHLGLSTLGEIVGWALPKHFPPRNGRTSKALSALGYSVMVHTD